MSGILGTGFIILVKQCWKPRSRTASDADDDHLENFVELVAADTNTFSFIMNYFAETHHPGLDQNTIIS